jgi:uncharacterized protein (DUF488 family)
VSSIEGDSFRRRIDPATRVRHGSPGTGVNRVVVVPSPVPGVPFLQMALTIWTVGHSTRSQAAFLALLTSFRIELVADVRRFAGSRRHPQFNRLALQTALAVDRIEYCWFPTMGGRRRPTRDSPNSAWRNEAFRGYADHLASEEFAEGLFELLLAANAVRTAILCAELLWWRCHRRLIADLLVSLEMGVVHILDGDTTQRHTLTAPARLVRGRLTYAPTTRQLTAP